MAVPKHNISAVQLQPPIKPCHRLADLAQVKSRRLCVIYPYSLFVVSVHIHMFVQIHMPCVCTVAKGWHGVSSSTLVCQQSLPLNPGLAGLTGLARQQALGILLLPPQH